MKNFILSIFCIILIQNQTLSQNTISGKIYDKITNQPIIGASVYINDLKRGSATDINGQFIIENIPNGRFIFEISYVGYKNISQSINIANNQIKLDFYLTESPTELNEVVITGVTRSTEINQNPIIIKPIDSYKLNQSAATNLIDGLKNVPGINQITTGASISKPTIRGLGYNRVISLLDGIRQEGQQWGDEHGIEIDEYAIDRIEIIKGPGSLLYGSDGIAGVLNFISPKAPPLGSLQTKLITNYQSNNNLIGTSISTAGSKNSLQWLGRFSHKIAGNYQNKYDGKVYNSGFSEYDGSVFLGINKKWGYSHFNFSSFNTSINLVEGERDSDGNFIFEKANSDGTTSTQTANNNDLGGYKKGFPNQTINHLRLTNNSYFILKKGSINLDIGIQNNKRREYADVLEPKNPELYFDLTSANFNLRYNLNSKNGWETSYGTGGMYQINKNKGLEFIIPEYHIFDIGAFIYTQKTFKEKLTLAGGLRFDNRKISSEMLIIDNLVKFAAFKNNFSNYSGSVGLSYQPSKLSTFKLNISRGFRGPNIAELSSNGKHEGTFRYEIGNAKLKAELSNQLDLGYFYNADHVSIEFTPFLNNISNYIFAEKLVSVFGGDSIPDKADGASGYKFIQGNAILVGGEIYMDVHPHPLDWLHIENSFSFVNATQKNQPDSLKYLPFIPPAKYRIELKAAFKKLGTSLSNVYFKIALDQYFMQNRYFKAYQSETATPAYTLLSAGAGAKIKSGSKADFLSVFISAENLTNTAYQSHLSRLKYAPINMATGRTGVFNMGRNISLKLVFSI